MPILKDDTERTYKGSSEKRILCTTTGDTEFKDTTLCVLDDK